MNKNTSGGLLVGILAACGFMWNDAGTVWACIGACVLAFLAEEARDACDDDLDLNGTGIVNGFDLDAVGSALATLSWLAVAAAAVFLML